MSTNSTMITINNVIEFIELNIKEEITLDDISNHVNLSKYHLNRIFKALTHKKLMEYVRNRQLTYSVYDLINTDLKIIDIAIEYNFQYEQSYIRSFKNTFGISPEKFRKEKSALKITDKINLKYITKIENDGIIINPIIKIKPKFTIIGIKYKLYWKNIDVLNEDSTNFYENQKNIIESSMLQEMDIANQVATDFNENQKYKIENALFPETYIAFIDNINESKDYIYYTTSLQVSNNKKIPTGMFCNQIPTQKYAVFKYIGLLHPRDLTFANLKEIHMYIFSVWLEKSGYTLSNDYYFQFIDNSIVREDYCEMDYYIPINLKT